MPNVAVENLTKRFGSNVVLDELSFEIADGELFTLLGPSGCGKTTTLLSIAGFVTPDRGSVACGGVTFVDAARQFDIPAERRNLLQPRVGGSRREQEDGVQAARSEQGWQTAAAK